MNVMSVIIPNTLQYPNFYVDELMSLLTPEENTVLMFAARQILGWDESRETRRAKISLSVFQAGYKVRGRQVTGGTGLSINTIQKCVDALCTFGVLKKVSTTADGTEYEINFDAKLIDFIKLKARQEDQDKKNSRRTTRATEAAKAKRGISSDDTLPTTSDDTLGGSSDDNIETKETQEKQQAENLLDTAEKTLPVEKAIVPEKITVQESSTSTDALFDAMRSESEGMPPLEELTAGVADPQAERIEFIAKWQPKIAQLYRLDDDATTARSVAAKLYDHRTVKRKRRMLDDAIEAVQRDGLPPSPFMFVPAIVAKLEVKRSRSVIKVSA